jgi:hypothetical protein
MLHILHEPDVRQRLRTARIVAAAGLVELPTRISPASNLDHSAAGLAGVDAVLVAEGIGLEGTNCALAPILETRHGPIPRHVKRRRRWMLLRSMPSSSIANSLAFHSTLAPAC